MHSLLVLTPPCRCAGSFNLFTNGLCVRFPPASLTLLESFQCQSLRVPLRVTISYITCSPSVTVDLMPGNLHSGIILEVIIQLMLV